MKRSNCDSIAHAAHADEKSSDATATVIECSVELSSIAASAERGRVFVVELDREVVEQVRALRRRVPRLRDLDDVVLGAADLGHRVSDEHVMIWSSIAS